MLNYEDQYLLDVKNAVIGKKAVKAMWGSKTKENLEALKDRLGPAWWDFVHARDSNGVRNGDNPVLIKEAFDRLVGGDK